MSLNIPKRKLLVISDTAVFKEQGVYMAFEPVVRELNSIASLFDEVIWLGCVIDKKDRALAIPAANIRIVAMPSISRSSFMNKLSLFINYPVFIFTILRYYFSATDVHTRAPSHPALLGILLSFATGKKRVWHKYAGNWVESDPPFMYGVQRSLLKKLRRKNVKTTVNGTWAEDNPQIVAFENPCMYENERTVAIASVPEKTFDKGLSLLFVGNLNKAKGLLQLIEAVEQGIPGEFRDLYIVGNGPLYNELKERAGAIKSINVEVLGPLKRDEINVYYKKCHCFILPSFSEGFPKVIAEAASYGCIPVVTDISSLSQYISNGTNGYLLKNNSPQVIADTLCTFVQNNNYRLLSDNATRLGEKFTYEYFRRRIELEIFTL